MRLQAGVDRTEEAWVRNSATGVLEAEAEVDCQPTMLSNSGKTISDTDEARDSFPLMLSKAPPASKEASPLCSPMPLSQAGQLQMPSTRRQVSQESTMSATSALAFPGLASQRIWPMPNEGTQSATSAMPGNPDQPSHKSSSEGAKDGSSSAHEPVATALVEQIMAGRPVESGVELAGEQDRDGKEKMEKAYDLTIAASSLMGGFTVREVLAAPGAVDFSHAWALVLYRLLLPLAAVLDLYAVVVLVLNRYLSARVWKTTARLVAEVARKASRDLEEKIVEWARQDEEAEMRAKREKEARQEARQEVERARAQREQKARDDKAAKREAKKKAEEKERGEVKQRSEAADMAWENAAAAHGEGGGQRLEGVAAAVLARLVVSAAVARSESIARVEAERREAEEKAMEEKAAKARREADEDARRVAEVRAKNEAEQREERAKERKRHRDNLQRLQQEPLSVSKTADQAVDSFLRQTADDRKRAMWAFLLSLPMFSVAAAAKQDSVGPVAVLLVGCAVMGAVIVRQMQLQTGEAERMREKLQGLLVLH